MLSCAVSTFFSASLGCGGGCARPGGVTAAMADGDASLRQCGGLRGAHSAAGGYSGGGGGREVVLASGESLHCCWAAAASPAQ